MTLYGKTILLLSTSIIPISILYFSDIIDIQVGALQIFPLIPLSLLIVRMVSYHILKRDGILFTSYKKPLTVLGIAILLMCFSVITLWQIEPSTVLTIFVVISTALVLIFGLLLKTELVISKNWILIEGELVHRSEIHAEVREDVLLVKNEKINLKTKIKSNIDEIKNYLNIEEKLARE
ncbi:MAG: hypothetical protein WAZ31_06255 [Rectinemataceae bacterium]